MVRVAAAETAEAAESRLALAHPAARPRARARPPVSTWPPPLPPRAALSNITWQNEDLKAEAIAAGAQPEWLGVAAEYQQKAGAGGR